MAYVLPSLRDIGTFYWPKPSTQVLGYDRDSVRERAVARPGRDFFPYRWRFPILDKEVEPVRAGARWEQNEAIVHSQNCSLERRGVTLVEMLVAMAITLVMMAAVVTLFARIGQGVNDSRATLDMSSRLRGVRNRLQTDLAGHTCPTIPWTRPEAGTGYFEYVEGFHSDLNPTSLQLQPGLSLVPTNDQGTYDVSSGRLIGLGDYDDILMFTVRSRGEPFVGKFGDTTIESPVAEVVWYCVENPADGSLGEPGMRTIYRRVLLVAPWTGTQVETVSALAAAPAENLAFFNAFDLSSHLEGSTGSPLLRVPNSLGDLTKRENRFAHRYMRGGFPDLVTTFPYAVRDRIHAPDLTKAEIFGGDTPRNALRPFGRPFNVDDTRKGEDVMLTNVLAFDVRAYDPTAQVVVPVNLDSPAVGPGNPGWSTSGTQVSEGAYVDLGYLAAPRSAFSQINPALKTTLNSGAETIRASAIGKRPTRPSLTRFKTDTPSPSATYDTWSFHYEHDGIDQDGDNLIDEGTNGFDDDSNNGVDDIGERETSPPYTVPLRGIEVKIRVYEPDSRQIREVTVRQSFVPE